MARRRRTGNVVRFAVFAGVSGFTHALVGSVRVDALATVGARALQALFDVLGAGCAFEAFRADTFDVSAQGQRARAPVAAR